MDRELSSVDSLLQQAGLLENARRSSGAAERAQAQADTLSRLSSITDLDADLLGVKLDDCSRYFKKEIMVVPLAN